MQSSENLVLINEPPSRQVRQENREFLRLYWVGGILGCFMDTNELLEQYAQGQRDFNSAKLSSVDLKGADLNDVNLSKANLQQANLTRASLTGANLSSLQNGYNANFSWADLSGTDLSHANVSSANFRHANLDSAKFSQTNLNSANLTNASLKNAILVRADLTSANLSGANLAGADLSQATLKSATLKNTDFQRTKIRGVDLSQASLFGVNMANADLERACLSDANLMMANFDGANLKKVNLTGANIYGATFKNADLTGAIMPNGEVYQPTTSEGEIGKQNTLLEKVIFMARQVIRTDNAPAPVGPYNQAIAASGQMIFVAGQIAIDPRLGDVVYTDDVKKQTEQVMANMEAILTASGASFADVVKTTVFLADMNDFAAVNAVYAQSFPEETAPARACVQVSRLPKNVLVEIDCIAVI